MKRSSTFVVVSALALAAAPVLIISACGDGQTPPPATPVPVTTVSGPASSSPEPTSSAKTIEAPTEKLVTCGDTTCKKGQQCCTGMPFPKPTCFDGKICPISRRSAKKEIVYLSPSDERAVAAELMRYRLASYRYSIEGETDAQHLGFIIDDVAPSPAVEESGERVDLYAYTSMAVATLKVQERRIEALERELADLRANKR
jgi:hypothetical protein